MSNQLLPCPFCNSSVMPGVKWAQCSNSSCPAFHIHTTNLDAWNRRATQPAAGEPEPFIVGNQYRTQAGDLVRFVAVHNEGKSYETMEDESGVNRYTRRDFGRCTGTAHDYSDPRNTPPLWCAPPAAAHGDEAVRKDAERYRFLRANSRVSSDAFAAGLDEVLDKAMRAQGDGGTV